MSKTTQIDIIRAFEKVLLKKSYAKINVKDITDICGLNRKTFYYYFSDINDLLVKTFDFEINNFFENQPLINHRNNIYDNQFAILLS